MFRRAWSSASRLWRWSVTKSIYLHFRCGAFRSTSDLFAVAVHRGVRLRIGKQAKVIANGGRLEVGARWDALPRLPAVLLLRDGARLIIGGDFRVFTGCSVYVNENATLEFGSGYINNNVNISCFSHITIGHDVAIAEDVAIRDSDNHHLSSSREMTAPVHVGDHVWIGMRSTILKGVTIGEGAVVAAGSVVTGDVPPRCLVGGTPARVIKENVTWE